MKVVVTGASGLLGRAVYSHLVSHSHEVLGLANSRVDGRLEKLDLLDTDVLKKRLQLFQPDVVVHAAAERRPDVVEREPERSQELNVDVPGRIAEICKDLCRGAKVIYISTDYVFDGSRPPYKADDEPNPLNAYGTSKLLGERAVHAKGEVDKVTALRVPVLYGSAKTPSESAVNVLQTTIIPPSNQGTIKMDAYAVRYPTCVEDIARVIGEIITRSAEEGVKLPPILQYQATEAMTKFDMCNVFVRLQNRHAPPLPEGSISHLDPEYEVDPMASTSRPRHCKMDTSVLSGFGVDVSHTSFEDWWSKEYEKQAAEETARQIAIEERRQAEAAKEERERKKRQEEEEAKKAQTQAEERKAREEREKAEAEAVKLRQAEETAKLRLQAEAEATGAPLSPQAEDKENDVSSGADPSRRVQSESSIEAATNASQPGSHLAPRSTGGSTDSALGPSLDANRLASPSSSRAITNAPSSPNPSFSSLRARPTPPPTSGDRTPSTSQPPSLRNAEGTLLSEESSPSVLSKQKADTQATPQTFQTIESTGATVGPRKGNQSGGDPSDEDVYGRPSPQTAPMILPHPDQSTNTATGPSNMINGAGKAIADRNGTDAAAEADGKKASSSRAKQSYPLPSFKIIVRDPHKVGDAMTGHIVYTVRTQTDATGFKAAQFSSLRRYSDFRWLHAALVHNNPGIIIPPVPEKVRGVFSRFSPDLVEARRHGLEICVNKVANHPVLTRDEDLKLFLESEDFARDVRLRDARKGPVPTPEAKTWMGWSGTVGVNSGQKFHEFDEWFDQQRAYLDSLEAQLKQMVKAINALAQSRKDLADSIEASSHALLMLSGSSLSRSLSACFAGLGDLQKRAQELEDVQSDSDVRHFGSVLYEYERVVGSVRKAFSTRIDTWHGMVKAEEDLRKTRVKHEKLKREGNAASHYYEDSLKDLADAEGRSLETHAEFDMVCKRCKEEMKRFDRERVADLTAAADVWLLGQIERRQELLDEWLDYTQKCLALDLNEGGSAAAVEQAKAGMDETVGEEQIKTDVEQSATETEVDDATTSASASTQRAAGVTEGATPETKTQIADAAQDSADAAIGSGEVKNNESTSAGDHEARDLVEEEAASLRPEMPESTSGGGALGIETETVDEAAEKVEGDQTV